MPHSTNLGLWINGKHIPRKKWAFSLTRYIYTAFKIFQEHKPATRSTLCYLIMHTLFFKDTTSYFNKQRYSLPLLYWKLLDPHFTLWVFLTDFQYIFCFKFFAHSFKIKFLISNHLTPYENFWWLVIYGYLQLKHSFWKVLGIPVSSQWYFEWVNLLITRIF